MCGRTWLEVVVDDGRLDLVEVSQRADRLDDDRPSLLLADVLVLLQVEVEVVAVAVLQHRAETTTRGRIRIIVTLTHTSQLRNYVQELRHEAAFASS